MKESLRARLKKLQKKPMPDFLTGCPVGGWPETRQAMLQISEHLPRRDERTYTLAEFIDATHGVIASDRYFRK